MSSWGYGKVYTNEKDIHDDEVRCYMEHELFIKKFDRINLEKYDNDKLSDFYEKTYTLNCGRCDGEDIDLFDLQKWFDNNRKWINSLKKECND